MPHFLEELLIGAGAICSSVVRAFAYGAMGRCNATTPSSHSLTSNRVTTNY